MLEKRTSVQLSHVQKFTLFQTFIVTGYHVHA
jgi:hypothetical protein